MELPSKLLEQIVFKARPKTEKHMLTIMGKSNHEDHIYQPSKTYIKQF